MAGRQNTSFLKRQKELKRTERANAKRAARQARREERATGTREEELIPEVADQTADQENDEVPE